MSRSIMPIMGSLFIRAIPFAMIAPHEARALRNHGQTLNRLADRGGLSVSETISILESRPWGSVKVCIENERYLINLVREWRQQNREQS